jgi:hypothetical protein
MAPIKETKTPRHAEARGTDLAPENRPGVPQEKPPRPLEGAPTELARQLGRPQHKRADLAAPTPVFGTAQPLHGLSGVLRRSAYAIPDNRPSHWMLLMGADRVDVVESALRDAFRNRPVRTSMVIVAVIAGLAALRSRS